jgi:molecular chaperone GrpE
MQSSHASEHGQAGQRPAGADADPTAAGERFERAPGGAGGAGGPGGPGGPDAPPPETQASGAPDAPQQSETEAALSEELARTTERLMRAVADLDNYRKRASRDVERLTTEARERLLRDWFEVADSVERALQQQPDGSLAEGLRAVLAQIDTVLARQGVQRIGAPGEPFDPERHEAISVQEDGSVPDGTVLAVARSGYAMGDRVLRPAQVVVSRTPAAAGGRAESA